MAKQGTPTMGGIAIVVAALVGWIVAHIRRGLPFSDQALIVWVGILVMAVHGLPRRLHQGPQGATTAASSGRRRTTSRCCSSFGIAWWLVAATGISETISLTRADCPGWHVPLVVWVVWAGLIIWATTNAVNVTDGLDGLAGGSALMGFGAFMIIAYWAFRNPDIYGAVVNPLDLAVLAAAFAGACVGFLWFNAAPARIIMGDVGALGLGSALALLALTTNTQLLLRADLRHQRDGGRLGGRADGACSRRRAASAAVPHVADPPPLRAGRLAGDDRDHPLLADRRRSAWPRRSASSSPTSHGSSTGGMP